MRAVWVMGTVLIGYWILLRTCSAMSVQREKSWSSHPNTGFKKSDFEIVSARDMVISSPTDGHLLSTEDDVLYRPSRTEEQGKATLLNTIIKVTKALLGEFNELVRSLEQRIIPAIDFGNEETELYHRIWNIKNFLNKDHTNDELEHIIRNSSIGSNISIPNDIAVYVSYRLNIGEEKVTLSDIQSYFNMKNLTHNALATMFVQFYEYLSLVASRANLYIDSETMLLNVFKNAPKLSKDVAKEVSQLVVVPYGGKDRVKRNIASTNLWFDLRFINKIISLFRFLLIPGYV